MIDALVKHQRARSAVTLLAHRRPRGWHWLAILAVPLAVGCGMRAHTAESAVIGAEAEYAELRTDAEQIAPAEAAVVEDELEYARQAVARRDYETAALAARVLRTRLRELKVRIELAERSRSVTGPDTLPDAAARGGPARPHPEGPMRDTTTQLSRRSPR